MMETCAKVSPLSSFFSHPRGKILYTLPPYFPPFHGFSFHLLLHFPAQTATQFAPSFRPSQEWIACGACCPLLGDVHYPLPFSTVQLDFELFLNSSPLDLKLFTYQTSAWLLLSSSSTSVAPLPNANLCHVRTIKQYSNLSLLTIKAPLSQCSEG